MVNEIFDKSKKIVIHKKKVKFTPESKIIVLTLPMLDILNNIKNDIYVEFSKKLNLKKYVEFDIENKKI